MNAPNLPSARMTALYFGPPMPRSRSKSNTSSPLQKNQQQAAPLTGSISGAAKGESVIRIGPAGWSYPDWSGYVYPSKRPKGFHEATFLAQFFDTIEINTSFYAPMRADHARQWIDRVSANPRFRFTAKLWQKFTHDAIVTPSVITPADEHAVREGFEVLRFWNNDVLRNTNGVLEVILSALQASPSPGSLRSPPSPFRGEGKGQSFSSGMVL